MMTPLPRVSFGIIVLNGEPFTRYCLRALYPFAHEIIVVEGAAPGAANVATPEGHSTDGTLEVLYRFKAEEDPEDKLQIVARDGFWSEKDEMSQAYAERATGDYLWQIDVDEFYKADDMRRVLRLLYDDPSITAISFKMLTFWGGFDYLVDGWYLQAGAEIYHRLFKWGRGYTYITHRPPTIHDERGRDLRTLKWLDGYMLARQHGMVMYHYSLVFPKQVMEKSSYYLHAGWWRKADTWANEVYFRLKRPFQVHNAYDHPSWLERFEGQHPEAILHMRNDIINKHIQVEVRSTDDIERILNRTSYQFGRAVLRATPGLLRTLYRKVLQMYQRFLRQVRHFRNKK